MCIRPFIHRSYDGFSQNTEKRDGVSFYLCMKKTEWFIASEVAGLTGMPTSARRARDELERLMEGKEEVKRKRSGTKAFEYHISILPTYVQEQLLDNNETHQEKTEAVDNIQGRNVDFLAEFALIPGYSIQVSAGHGTSPTSTNEEPCRYLAFRRKWLNYRGFNEKDLAIVWAKGDSMEPTINNNDTLVVHLGRTVPQDGHIYIFRNGEELFVKRYQNMLGAWRLKSDNSLYDTVDVKKEDQHQFQCVGQVVHIAKDLDA